MPVPLLGAGELIEIFRVQLVDCQSIVLYAAVQFGNGVRVEWRNAVIKARIAERRL